MGDLDAVTSPDDDLGVKQSPVVDHVIVDRDATDSDEPRPEIAALRPGDRVRIAGVECDITGIGQRVENGQRHLYRLGIPVEAFGTVASMYVDRDPYLLDICNGPIYVVEPSEVVVCG